MRLGQLLLELLDFPQQLLALLRIEGGAGVLRRGGWGGGGGVKALAMRPCVEATHGRLGLIKSTARYQLRGRAETHFWPPIETRGLLSKAEDFVEVSRDRSWSDLLVRGVICQILDEKCPGFLQHLGKLASKIPP